MAQSDRDIGKDVFEYLSAQIEALPQQIKQEYIDVTVKTVDNYFDKFARDLKNTSESDELNLRMKVDDPYKPKADVYVRRLDWDDKTIVNEAQGKRWGTYADRARGKRKRNYSIVPATYHDLAFIINYGHVDSRSGALITGNHFIERANKKLKRWKSKRDREFEKYLNRIKKG